MPLSEFSLRSGGNFSQNIFWQSANYALEAIVYNFDTLVITFEAAGDPISRPQKFREGWGESMFRPRNVSALYVKPFKVDWYREPDLAALLQEISESGFFAQFKKIVTYGGSMGGFAALVFADLVGAAKVVSMNPQSTLNPQKVPWENRFKAQQQAYNWTSEYSDVVDHLRNATAYLIYDKRFKLDRLHADRIRSADANVIEFNMPFVGHHIPSHLVATGTMLPLLSSILDGDDFSSSFRKKVRARRDLARYYNILENADRVMGSNTFKNIVARHKQVSPLVGME